MAYVADQLSSNIGNDVRAIWRHYDDSASLEFIQERQLIHVEILSLMSFSGRLTSGTSSLAIIQFPAQLSLTLSHH